MRNSEYCYVYDGSFDGLLNVVFESLSLKEIPQAVHRGEAHTLLPVRTVASDAEKAARVLNGVKNKIGADAYQNVRSCFLAEFPDKEIKLIRYLSKGFEVGEAVNKLLSHDDVMPLLIGIRALYKERYAFVEFLRFSDYNGNLVGIIEPQNNVLPLLGPHFTTRFKNETFMIYDKTHGLAFIYADKKAKIIPADEFDFPPVTEEEKKFRILWRMFYDTAAIEERKNERLRMGHLPKKYWKNMTEFLND